MVGGLLAIIHERCARGGWGCTGMIRVRHGTSRVVATRAATTCTGVEPCRLGFSCSSASGVLDGVEEQLWPWFWPSSCRGSSEAAELPTRRPIRAFLSATG